MEILKQIADNLQRGEDETVGALTRQAVEQKIPAGQILDEGLIAGMNVVGEAFRTHQVFLPEVLLSARAMYAGMDVLKPLLTEQGVPRAGKVVIGTIKGDLHDIGKNLVGIMLEGAGFEVVDLGNDVSPERFVDTAVAEGAPVIGMSALLTTTMTGMKDVVQLIQERSLTGQLKTIVGGAPVSAEFAKEIGADAHGFDAANAVERVKALVG
jgi:5-methyltetrahydrofolate--homocysteine methyltransferase